MPVKAFYDTNLWVYSFLDSPLEKDISKKKTVETCLLTYSSVTVSTQVLNELSNVFLKKYKTDENKVKKFIEALLEISHLYIVDEKTLFKALQLRKKYYLSFYDALIISSALDSGCKILLTEDLQHNLIVEKKLTIINPFI